MLESLLQSPAFFPHSVFGEFTQSAAKVVSDPTRRERRTWRSTIRQDLSYSGNLKNMKPLKRAVRMIQRPIKMPSPAIGDLEKQSMPRRIMKHTLPVARYMNPKFSAIILAEQER